MRRIYNFCCLIVLLTLTTSTQGNDTCNHLPKSSKKSSCHFWEDHHRLTCYHDFDRLGQFRLENVRALILCSWKHKILDSEELIAKFPSLGKLIVSNGSLTEFSPFPESQTLEKISITGTHIQKIPEDAFIKLQNLQSVDIRYNHLGSLDVSEFNISSLHRLYLSGNPWKCNEDINWILDETKHSLGSKIVDRDKLQCSAPYEGRPLVPVLKIIMALKEECKRTVCNCELNYVVTRGGKIPGQLLAFVSLNCSHRNLMELPEFLPKNTTALHLTGNRIRNLKPVIANPYYRGVIDLYLDSNLIESIDILEGSHWLDQFRLLSLRNNKLSDLPTYALENVLPHSGNAASLYLGNNPWRCDCHFTPGFQDLMTRYPNLIKDLNTVRCSNTSGENSKKPIRELTRTEICTTHEHEPWLHPLDILNITLGSLIILILANLLYDYWSYKKTGKLPWIVSKIP